MNIHERLHHIQQNLIAPKSQHNKFGNYNYRTSEDILEAIKPLAGDANVLLSDELTQVGDRYYVKATATLQLKDEQISVTAYAREAEIKKGMDESQITGSASSYARKYALSGLFAIDDTKDHDSNELNSQRKAAPAVDRVQYMLNIVPKAKSLQVLEQYAKKVSEIDENEPGINQLRELLQQRREELEQGEEVIE